MPAQDLSGDCEFSLDGRTWAAAVKVDDLSLKPGADGKVHVQVRPAGTGAGCTVSLASYRAHGATWNTSGAQVFHDFDTVSVKAGETGSLDIAVPDAGCYTQVDLYRGSVRYDGVRDANDGLVHGDLPEGPGRPVIKEKNISWWNGGTRDCTTDALPTPSATTSAPAGQEPTPETTTPAAAVTTPASPTEPPTPGEPSLSTTPSASEGGTGGQAASDGPSASDGPVASEAPSSSAPAPAPEGDLAETGGGNVTGIAAAAAALLLAGAGLVAVRRRRNTNNPA
ncbi:LAETG motif-containing sortase-dependent surface protein [Streptomyces roseolus]|uniref:LAETG motif-containing sortase-dependent surface protein n=1 Tax=Streptomyces roseolus TaxID=67358 RepID=UPI0037967EE9